MKHPAASRLVQQVVVVAVLGASGCSLISGSYEGDHPGKRTADPTVSAKPGDATGGHHVRSGWAGVSNNRYTLDVHRVERYAKYSVLYVDLTLKAGTGMLGAAFGDDAEDASFTRFRLLDPVNGKYYRPLREGDSDGKTFGSRMGDYPGAAAGVRHVLQLYFPPVPSGVSQLTVLTPGTTGEMTGIPVVSGAAKDAPLPRPNAEKTGTPHFFRVYPPTGKVYSDVTDLHDYIEGEQKTTSTGGGEQKLALRADVLFAFDKATLSSKATQVLDNAIEETRDRADPAKPPITITGYTDSKGGDTYNLKLSRRRAQAVEKYVSAKLGSAYRYRTAGKGEADPVAANTHHDGSDDPAGRAKNRRVEIGYKLKETTPRTTTTTSATPGPGGVSSPAAFRTGGDGPVIGSSPGHVAGFSKARVDVHPFYRDGAYMVGVFTVHNTGSQVMSAGFEVNYTGDAIPHAMGGADYGGIIATDTAHRTRYYQEREGGFDHGTAGFVNGEVDGVEADADNRLYVYYPAPPAGVTKVDVSVGDRGTIRNVPIR